MKPVPLAPLCAAAQEASLRPGEGPTHALAETGHGFGRWRAAPLGLRVELPAHTVAFPLRQRPALDGIDC